MRRINVATMGFAKRVVSTLAVVAFAMVGAVSCGSDSTSEPTPQYENGVKIVGEMLKEVNAAENIVTRTVMTDAGYTTSVDVDWITITEKATGTKAGSYAIKMTVAKNTTGSVREASVYITVEGFNTTKLATIKQLAVGSKDPVITYMDDRLMKEYLWMDEYNEKRETFNYALKYDAFLEKSLLSLKTNIEDGGYEADGSRYIFSTIQYLGTQSPYASTRAGASEYGWGIVLSSYPIGMGGGAVALPVNHVYAGSPADKAGMKRGAWITHFNNAEITQSNYANVWYEIMYGNPRSVAFKWESAFSNKSVTETIAPGNYQPNPVAKAVVLDLSNYPEFSGKKIGYLAYLGFEYEYRQELVDAFNFFKTEGITDLVIDLTSNGGGEVNTSVYLASMIIDESFVGTFYGDMRHHENNPHGDIDMYIESQTDDTPAIQLPHLGLQKVYILTTGMTASASEATIAGLDGLDIDVVVVGEEFTRGKNCGMDTETLKIGNGWYYFAPITFRIFNAKGWNDYADGIAADLNIKTFYNEADLQSNPKKKDIVFYYFPLPLDEWDNFYYNPALQAALADMIGKSAKTDDIFGLNSMGNNNGGAISSTRGGSVRNVQIMEPIIDKQKDMRSMYIDKESVEANREKHNN